jgi:hypothetical protein
MSRHGFVPPDQWGYAYLYAERPSIRVREMVSEDFTPASYWRFRDNYHFQLGNGINGDLTNDFKFQFGGAVYRDETDGFRWYGAYGSFFVLIPEQAPEGGRVMPPFRGNGGGPDGGPLMTLKGRAIDLFFHPTALRPGSILDLYDPVSVAGYSAPTLPSRIDVVVTSPTGKERRIGGRANKAGYFHEPGTDFLVNEPGVWRVRMNILFDGRTSAGQVTEPFPTGDVLGSRSGEFFFYAVDRRSPQLELKTMPQFVRPADGPIRFDVVTPAGLTDVELAYTATMPGFILEEGTTRSLRYTYDATKLARDFPNLDLEDPDGFGGMDPISISLLLSGTDAGGRRQHFARQLVIQGEELQMPAQPPGQPKQRSVRK